MKVVWKITKRFAFFVAALFLCLNVVSWVVLNSPPVQRALVGWMNREALAPRGLELTLGSLAVKFFSSSVVIEDVRIRVLDDAQRVDSFSGEAQDLKLGAHTVEVGIDVLTSWLRKELVVNKASVDGLFLNIAYDRDGNLILPFKTDQQSAGPVEDLVKQARQFLPSEFELTNAHATLGQERSPHYQSIRLESLQLTNRKQDINVIPLVASAKWGPSVVRWPTLPADVAVESATVVLQVSNGLELSVETAEAITSLGNVGAKGIVVLPIDGRALDYRLEVTSDVDFGAVMQLVELQGAGRVDLQGLVWADSKDLAVPQFEGSLSWKNVDLEGFAIYSGSANAKLNKRAIDYSDALIKTPLGGSLRSEGRFELYGDFIYANNVKVEAFPFLELLSGLGVRTEAFEFLINSNDMAVDGSIMSKGELAFRLDLNGLINAKSLRVPGLEDGRRVPLPDCDANVRLFTDDKALDLKGTTLSCANSDEDNALVEKGTVRYSDGKTEFRFQYKDANLASATYFTGFPAEGKADFTGVVTAGPGEGVTFRTSTKAREVLLYGIRYATVEGQWGVNAEGVFGTGLVGIMTQQQSGSAGTEGLGAAGNALARIDLDEFQVGFDSNTTSLFRGHVEGSVATALESMRAHLPPSFPSMTGVVQRTSVDMEGPLLSPFRWNLQVDGSVLGLEMFGFRAEQAKVHLSCSVGVCRNSKVFAEKLSEVRVNGERLPTPRASFLLADVRELSENFVNVRAVVRSLPFRVPFGERFPVQGVVDARADILGPWKSWEGSFQLSADALRLGEQDLGSATVSGYSVGAREINVVAYARYQQISLRLRMPHSLSGPSTLYARTRGLDVGFLLPSATVAKHNLFTQFDGEVLFNGPAPLTPFDSGDKGWISRWQAQGSLSRALFQTRQLRFSLEKPANFVLQDALLSASRFRLVAPAGFLEMEGSYDFQSAEVQADVDASVKLGILGDLFGKVGEAEGNFVADVRVEGVAPELSVTGDAKLEGGVVGLREYPPPFTNIEGSFLFGEESIEVRSLRAKKGVGDVELAGSIHFARWLEDSSRSPVIAMRMRASDAQVRIPTPYVDFFDTTLDGTLELFGSERPYTLAGEVRVKRAAAFREKTCQDLLAEEETPRVEELRLGARTFANFNIQVLSDKGISIQTACVKTRLSANVKLTGSTESPVLSGAIEAERSGNVSFLKSNFTIQKAEFVFDNPVRLDPRLDIQLNSRIDSYTVFVQVDGTLSRRRTNLWVDPPNTPDGATLGRSDIFRMLSTGQPPNRAGTQGQALVAQAAAYGTSILALDDSLTQAAQRLTGGFVDSVQLQPVIENGQTRWKARVSRSLGERLSLGLDIEQGQAVNNQSLNGTVFINESVNLLGGFDRKSEQSEQYYELSGGLRFQFGSRQ